MFVRLGCGGAAARGSVIAVAVEAMMGRTVGRCIVKIDSGVEGRKNMKSKLMDCCKTYY